MRNLIKEEIYLNELVRICTSLNEERKPDMEWDFTQVKDVIDKSKEGVETKPEVLDYLERLLEKIKNLPKRMKIKIIKYVLISFTTILSVSQLYQAINQVSDEPVKIEVIGSDLMVDLPEEGVEEVYQEIRKPSQKVYDFLKDEEKLKTTAYDIGDGMITVGYGHAERKGETDMVAGKTKISEKEANELLKQDVATQTKYLNHILDQWEEKGIKPELTQGMYDAMISLMFNMGYGNFRKADFVQDIKKGDFETAQKKIKTTHITYPGHKPRREKESQMFGS
jgi:GH24 family phage-related lysozyme (muramidase)